MDSGHLFFDSSLTRGRGGGQMIVLGGRNTGYRGTGSMLALSEDGGKRRPFFTGPDEYFEEEYYDEQLPEKKRRLTVEQVHLLEKSFEADNKLEPERKTELARNLGLQPRQVAVWFQNRRARWKNKQIESDYDRLKASYDSLVVDHEALLKDNNRLRAQVILLTEKLQAKEQSGQGFSEVVVNDQVGSSADLTALNFQQKFEDRQSSGSGGSAVVDEKRAQNVVDGSTDFLESYNCLRPLDGGVQSEEDDASDEGCSYYTEQIFAQPHQPEVDAELGWWVWG